MPASFNLSVYLVKDSYKQADDDKRYYFTVFAGTNAVPSYPPSSSKIT
ncbi:MAG: hypothetical protein M3299_17135 [Thermoproteota archaeon]|nr:hypothetical protein [Thermoproteota archaeon]